MKTVRDFKNLFKKQFDFDDHSNLEGDSRALWIKLNYLGTSKGSSDTPDIDASAILTREEWNDLCAKLSFIILHEKRLEISEMKNELLRKHLENKTIAWIHSPEEWHRLCKNLSDFMLNNLKNKLSALCEEMVAMYSN